LRDRFGGTSDRYYALADYFQTTAIANTSGVVEETYTFSAFGIPLSSSSYGWEYLFGSYYYDVETGLYQVRFRYYHSGIGRWLSRDPLGKSVGPNLYDYVRNDPIRFIDRLGLCPCGQHLELDPEAFAKTWETMTGLGAVDAASVSAFGLAHSSPETVDALSSAASEIGIGENVVPLAADAAEIADPVLTLYGVAVATGDFIGSLHCVPDGPDGPDASGPYNAFTPSGMPYQADQYGHPLPGTPGSPELPTPNNYPNGTGQYVPNYPGADLMIQ